MTSKLTLPRPIRLFLLAHGALAFALGVHQVLLAWLSIGVLHLPAHQVGWVQAAALLPNLGFMLIAGALADRRNVFSVMHTAQLGLLIAYALLAILLQFETLSFLSLMGYAAIVGTANAFLQPAREKVIGELSEQSFQLKITRASLVQFSLQACGIAVAALSEQTGILSVVVAQVLATLLAGMQLLRLKREMAGQGVILQGVTRSAPSMLFRHILQGLVAALSDRRIAQLIGLVSFNGFMHMGLFLVALPLMSRDIYHFNAMKYGLLQFVFVAGMLGAYLLLMFKEHISYPAQGALFSLLYTAVVGFALSRQPTVAGLYILVMFWGWVAGYSATHCRLIIQILAKPEIKGRLMSLYQLMLFGMAPLGALTTGYFSSLYSLSDMFKTMSIASVALFCLFLFSRSLWKVEQTR